MIRCDGCGTDDGERFDELDATLCAGCAQRVAPRSLENARGSTETPWQTRLRARTREGAPKGSERGVRCSSDLCRCTHDDGCSGGWLAVERAVLPTRLPATRHAPAVDTTERVRGRTSDTAVPCPTCRPELAALLRDHDRAAALALARERGKHARSAAAVKRADAQTVDDRSEWWKQ